MECSEWTGLSTYLIWGQALHDETKNAWLHRKLTEEAFRKNIKFLLWNLRNKWYSAKQKFCKEASFDDNTHRISSTDLEVRGGPDGRGSQIARLNFKTSRVGVYKCLSLIVGFAVFVAIWPREVVSCGDFILHAVATF